MKKLVIFGTSEIARVAAEYFEHDSDYDIVAFCIDRPYIVNDTFLGRDVIATDELPDRIPPTEADVFVAIGSQKLNRIREQKYLQMKSLGYRMASYVSSKAFVWTNVEIGDNCFILEQNTLQPFVTIGNNVTLWSGNHIGHGTKIEDHVFIASHAVLSGLCEIGKNTFIGVNAATAEGVRIGADNFISMGASVNVSTEPNTLVGAPKSERKADIAKRFNKVKD